MTPGDFVREVVVRLIFLDWTAKRRAALHTGVRRIRTRRRLAHGKGIHRLKIAIAKVAEDISMKFIGPGAGDDVHHTAGRASVLRRVAVRDDLKFLHSFLGDG